MSGYYLMHRGWMDNPALGGKRDPYCKRAAWAWLIEEAVWKDTRANVGGKWVDLKRGQLCCAYRYLAEAWGWSLGAVQRFIDRLETDTMVMRIVANGRLILTICKYDEYQVSARIGNASDDTQTDTRPIRDRYATDTKENTGKELTKEAEASLESAPDGQPVDAPQSKAKRSPSSAPKATRLPTDWTLPADWRTWAVHEGAAPELIAREAAKFSDYWHAKAGANGRKADWPATWRNWIRRALENSNGRRGGSSIGSRNGNGFLGLREQQPRNGLGNPDDDQLGWGGPSFDLEAASYGRA
ncbi:hypothetical protein [Azospirillum himalayense]|uniref:DUF1376 domain-containing protein n=1 Tax=Azospirillum himalayense TaxID=654847 RepID=A0ABW0FY45_9PROT